MNLIVIKGRLVSDPELKQTNNGTAVCSVSLAVNRQNSKDNAADFFSVVFWRQTAEFVSKYFTKGREMLVQGTMQSRKYEDKNGNIRTAWDVVADRVEFCGNKSDVGGDVAPTAKRTSGSAGDAPSRPNPPTALDDTNGDDGDELPF